MLNQSITQYIFLNNESMSIEKFMEKIHELLGIQGDDLQLYINAARFAGYDVNILKGGI